MEENPIATKTIQPSQPSMILSLLVFDGKCVLCSVGKNDAMGQEENLRYATLPSPEPATHSCIVQDNVTFNTVLVVTGGKGCKSDENSCPEIQCPDHDC